MDDDGRLVCWCCAARVIVDVIVLSAIDVGVAFVFVVVQKCFCQKLILNFNFDSGHYSKFFFWFGLVLVFVYFVAIRERGCCLSSSLDVNDFSADISYAACCRCLGCAATCCRCPLYDFHITDTHRSDLKKSLIICLNFNLIHNLVELN